MENKNNYCVILAGGVGRRLWPSSRKQLPKQFLDLFGSGRTLLQQTYDRVSALVPPENILVSTYKGYVDLVHEQLPDICEAHILAEPVQLSTAPAVAWASFRIATKDPSANIIITPADQCILNNACFEEDIRSGLAFAAEHNDILALGVAPTTANTGYGYIQMGNSRSDDGKFWNVKAFTEKPDRQFAEMFVESGEFIWNTGLFVYSAKTILGQLNALLPTIAQKVAEADKELTPEEELRLIEELYPASLRLAIDLVFLEKCDNVVVQKCSFGWADVGSWTQIHEMSELDADGNAVNKGARAMFIGSSNNYVHLPSGMVAAVQDLEGYLIAQEGNVLVICPNDDSSRIRRLVAEAQMHFGNEVV